MIIGPFFALLAAAQPAAAPLPGQLHIFADYTAGCDNGLVCEALSLVPEAADRQETPAGQRDPSERFGVLKVYREAGANAPATVTLSDFDGTPARLLQGDEALDVRLVRESDGVWRIEAADLGALLSGLYADTLTLKDAAGTVIGEFAAKGLREALLYIDERQGRLQTPTALVVRGWHPASAVPAASPLPIVRAAPAAREVAMTLSTTELTAARRAQGCSRADAGNLNVTEQQVYALGGGRTLVMMDCGTGAYNSQSAPLIATREGGRLRIVPALFDVGADQDDPHGRKLLTNVEFDPATMTAHEWIKGRGLGDCGVSATYVWDGAMFRLTEQNEMGECRGTLELITTWRARVLR